MAFFTITQVAETFITLEYWRLAFIYGAAGFLIVFAFQAIALYTIATRNGIGHRWMAFIPILSTYYIGICARKNRALGLDSKVVGTALAVLELVLCVGYIMHYVGYHFAEQNNYTFIEEQPYFYGMVLREVKLDQSIYASSLAWAGFCFEILGEILDWIKLVYLFLQVMILSAFFQTYSARRYFLFTIISILVPVQGILFFAVRNNKGMSYREYLMREQERQYRMYRQYNQNNQYNQPNNYNGSSDYNGVPRQDIKNEDPFNEFGSSDDDPFSN